MKKKCAPVKFLLVDDKEENLLALEALLRRDGLELLKAQSGEAALELLLSHDVALALVDVQMPDMDGFALAELMRGSERSKHVPIIFVTAAPQEQGRIFRGYDAGAVDFLFKPIEPRVLKHKADVFFELHEQRRALAETLRFNETFIAAVGHDLRNPLNTIIMAAEVVLESTGESLTRETVERIANSGRAMSRLVNDLFDLARARLGQGIVLSRTKVDLRDTIDHVIAEFRLAQPSRAFTVCAAGECAGQWDEGRLRQMLSNLIGNAIRHGDPATPVEVSAKEHADGITVSVHNLGIIAPDLLPHIFDPFRAGTDRGRADGLGLGLYIVQQIVQAHGGTISVSSSEATGTAFRIELPRGSAAAVTAGRARTG